jgi:ABC-2 type transport system ATP-binding protein
MIDMDTVVESVSAVEASSAATAVSVRAVTMKFPIPKRYREWVSSPFTPRRAVTALKRASLEVKAGDRVAVMGPNGAGKTTLLKLIGGLLLPTAGEIVVNGHSTLSENAAVRRNVGFVFNEERSFYWRLTGTQNLEFFGALENLWGEPLRTRIRSLMKLVGLEDAGGRRVSDYSSGMMQRLAVARVMLADPEILILDEPTRALDPVACDEMSELILAEIYKAQKKTLLIATHRPEEALKLCNKVVIIDGGQIRGFANMRDVAKTASSLLDFYLRTVNSEKRDA